MLYTQAGPLPATKIILKRSGCCTDYHPDMFGNTTVGYRYYPEVQPIIKCTHEAYMERSLQAMIIAAG